MRVLGMGDSEGVRAAPAMGGPEEGLGLGERFSTYKLRRIVTRAAG